MKKLLVLFLVLGMASLANATMSIDASGYDDIAGAGTFDIQLDPVLHLQGTTVELSVASGTGTVGAAAGFGQFTMFGMVGGSVFELPPMGQVASTATSTMWAGAGTTGVGYMSPVMDVVSGIAATNVGKTTFVLTTGIGATLMNDGTWQAAGNIMDDGVTMDLGDDGGVINNYLAHYTTPEPMTLTLLGLGGLGLLRRRR